MSLLHFCTSCEKRLWQTICNYLFKDVCRAKTVAIEVMSPCRTMGGVFLLPSILKNNIFLWKKFRQALLPIRAP
jgi:hypothetical protein